MFCYFLPCNSETERVRQEEISGVPFIRDQQSSWAVCQIVFSFPQKMNNKLIVPLASNLCDSKRENLPWGDQQNFASVTDNSPYYTKFKI